MSKPGNPLFLTEDHPGKKFSADYQPGGAGRKPGVSRTTIARKVLSMSATMPEEMFITLKAMFPEIEEKMTFEEIGTIALAAAMAKGDVSAYKALMDSAYGAPKQEIDYQDLNNPRTLRVEIVPPDPVDE